MLYYQVKKSADQKEMGIRFKSGFLIGDELYTEKEIQKAVNLGRLDAIKIHLYFDAVQLKPKDTFFFFGARKTSSI